jgi:uncharacterized protein (DUF58 family)
MVIRKKFLGFIFLAGGFFILWAITGDFLLLSLWLSILILVSASYLWTKIAIRKLSVQRFSKSQAITAGRMFAERLEIRNNGRTARYLLQIEDRSGLLSGIHSRAVSRLGGGEIRVQTIKALVNQRGFYPLGPTSVSTGDPFGFFSAFVTFPAEKQLTVFPYTPLIPRFAAAGGSQSGEQDLMKRSAQPTPQAWGVREFQPGDPLNRVHWPFTLKKGELMVKEFDQDTQTAVWVILDSQGGIYPHASEQFTPALDWNLVSIKERGHYKLPRDAFEYAVSTSAALCKYYLEMGQSLGFASNGRKVDIFPSEKGPRQLNKLLFHLAGIRDDGKLDVINLLNQQTKNIARGSLMLLVTGRNSTLFSQSAQLARHWGLNLKVIHIDTDSFSTNPVKAEEPQLNKNIIRIGYGDDISEVLSMGIGATYRKAGSGRSLPQPNPRG